MRSAIRNTTPSGRLHANRSRSFWPCTAARPIASPASRQFGTPRSPVTPCSKSAAIAPSRKPAKVSNGWCPSRSSTSKAIGSRGGPTSLPAAGRSNTPTRTIPTWTIRRGGVMAMDRAQGVGAQHDFRASIAAGREWILGMQSHNGAWGAFDADNEYYYLNNIPFADHGALLDPPTEDVTARCVSMLAQIDETAP